MVLPQGNGGFLFVLRNVRIASERIIVKSLSVTSRLGVTFKGQDNYGFLHYLSNDLHSSSQDCIITDSPIL